MHELSGIIYTKLSKAKFINPGTEKGELNLLCNILHDTSAQCTYV